MNYKRGALSLEILGKYIIVLIVVGIGTLLIYNLIKPISKESIRDQIFEMLQGEKIPICRNYEPFQLTNKRDFQAISFARFLGKCDTKTNIVILDFVLSKEFLEKFLRDFDIVSHDNPLWIFKDECEPYTAFKGFIIEGKEKKVLFPKGRKLKISNLGKSVGLCPFIEKDLGESCDIDLECKSNLKCLPKDAELLISCNDYDVVALINNSILAMGTSKPILDCCSQESLNFFRNVAKYFKGDKILVIWETSFKGKKFDRNFSKLDNLKDYLSNDGITLEKMRHVSTNKINLSLLKNYDQVWIIQPGWCDGFTREGNPRKSEPYCSDILDWSVEELTSLELFLNSGGKILVTSSYSDYENIENMPQSVPNQILSFVNPKIEFVENPPYGCSGNRLKIMKHEITQNMRDFEIKGSASLNLPKICKEKD